MDYSTISIEELKKLPVYELPPTYQLQKDPGNGCINDPPGYPTYFTRSVYTQYGNTPRNAKAEEVIEYEGKLYITRSSKDWRTGDTWDTVSARYQKRLRRLWKPLPLNHLRVQLWIQSIYAYFKGCWEDPSVKDRTNVSNLVIPSSINKQDRLFDLGTKAKLAEVCVPENYRPTRVVKEFYPEHEYDEIEAHQSRTCVPHWWETEAEVPNPCKPRSCGPHPINGSWCQWCGWKAA